MAFSDLTVCQIIYTGSLIVWTLAEAEARYGFKLMRHAILDAERSSDQGVKMTHSWFLSYNAKRFVAYCRWSPAIRGTNIAPWIIRWALIVATAAAASFPRSTITQAIVAVVTLSAGRWQMERLGDHSMHLSGFATLLPVVVPNAMLGPLLRVIVAWHYGSAGVQKLRVGGLSWMTADSRRLTTSVLLSTLEAKDDRIGAVRLVRCTMTWIATLPGWLLSCLGTVALAMEIVLPALIAGMPHILFPSLRYFDSTIFYSASLLSLHVGIWLSTGMLFLGNLPACVAIAASGNASQPNMYYGDLAYANVLSIVLWIATWLYMEDFPLCHMGVFVYNKSQADYFRNEFQNPNGRRLIAWASSDSSSEPRPGQRVALNLNSCDSSCAYIDLAATVTRAYSNGTFPTYAIGGFFDRVPSPRMHAPTCVLAARKWLEDNTLIFDTHQQSLLKEVAVVDVEANNLGDMRIVRIVASGSTAEDCLRQPLLHA